MKEIFSIGEETTEYAVGNGIAGEAISEMEKTVYITSSTITNRFSKILDLPDERTIMVEDGENAKSFETYESIISTLLGMDIQRDHTLCYIGGGTLGDISGFVASTYMRGIGLAAIPTTLLSMIDSSIGGKNGINVSGKKNMAGTFRNPRTILADTMFIENQKELVKNGLPEAIKHGMILKAPLIEKLEKLSMDQLMYSANLEEFILENARIKADVCNTDPFDMKRFRNILNFGHTVGHGIEAASGWSVSHGEAVMSGMILEALATQNMGLTDPEVPERLLKLSERYGIDIGITKNFYEKIIEYIKFDKKINGNRIFLPVIRDVGVSEVLEMDFKKFMDALESILEE